MTRYVYYAYNRSNKDDLEHFDFPIKLPKIKPPKFPTVGSSAGKNAINNLKKTASGTLNDLGKSAKSTTGKLKKKLDREWKKHKWIDRKRDKNGKWIYDYGNGFPGEKKKSIGETYDLAELSEAAKTNPSLKSALGNIFDMNSSDVNDTKQVSKGLRFIANLANLGLSGTLLSPTAALNSGATALNDLGISVKKLKSDISKRGDKIDPKTGLRLKRHKTSKEDDLAKTNPSYGMSDNTGNMNCYSCTVAYDLRKRGYDVTAVEDLNGANMGTIKKLYKNAKPKIVSPSPDEYTKGAYVDERGIVHNGALTNEMKSNLAKEPNGSSGYMVVKWSNGGGHAVAYEKENGKTMIYDPQNGQKYELEEYLDYSIDAAYFRTDNLEVDFEEAKKVVD